MRKDLEIPDIREILQSDQQRLDDIIDELRRKMGSRKEVQDRDGSPDGQPVPGNRKNGG